MISKGRTRVSPITRRLKPVDITRVTFSDCFWSPRIETNRKVTLAHEYKMCKDTGRFEAFKLAWKAGQPNQPHHYWDSDVAKWVEAVSCTLATDSDAKLDRQLEGVVKLIAGAQQPDGYLNSYYTQVEPGNRWSDLCSMHELYCAGHLIEAAVAHYHATGCRTLLDTMCRYANYIDSVFGSGRKRLRGYPGHEEIELALVKLYHATGEKRYLNLSRFFIYERGRQPHYFEQEATKRGQKPAFWSGRGRYYQADIPVRQQHDAVGHSVRAMYLYCGMADVAAETDDRELFAACKRLWDSTTTRRMYITGGIGSRREGETFGQDYELPNEIGYAETCAAIGLVFFAHRMLQIEANARYTDVMERALYNGVLSGVSLDGKRFFYSNPLAVYPEHRGEEPHWSAGRVGWFDVSCCPPNIARLLASLGMYAYSTADRDLYVHLYIGGSVRTELAGQEVTLSQQTDYPWSGKIILTLNTDRPVRGRIMLRVPGWCTKHKIKINGRNIDAAITKGYARLSRTWHDDDIIELSLDMPVQRIQAHPKLTDNVGAVALQRGPVVYCLEQCDHKPDLRAIRLLRRAKLTSRFDAKLLGGTPVIEGSGVAVPLTGWKNKLYRAESKEDTQPVSIKAIPYCLWNNRKAGAMTVWIPQA